MLSNNLKMKGEPHLARCLRGTVCGIQIRCLGRRELEQLGGVSGGLRLPLSGQPIRPVTIQRCLLAVYKGAEGQHLHRCLKREEGLPG